MSLSSEGLRREAAKTGFRIEVIEKVDRLLELLNAIGRHPFLKSRMALKGGTALNLFVFDVPRLSVDVDLNYIGAVDREAMLAEREALEQALKAVAARLGLGVRRAPTEHAGGKWQLRYASALGQGGTLELDVNYMYRSPLWEPVTRNSRPLGSLEARGVKVLDLHELAAGKLTALLARRASRDLFDAHQLLATQSFDERRLRLAFVLYGAMNRRDWRTVGVDDVTANPRELRNQLAPTLRTGAIKEMGQGEWWTRELIEDCRKALSVVLPLSAAERGFLDALLDHGEIRPDLLDIGDSQAELIMRHPALMWKARNVKQHSTR